MKYICLTLVVLVLACGGKDSNEIKRIKDLPFHEAKDAKSYADVVLKAIRTDRDLPVWQEFSDNTNVNKDSLHLIVSMYSTGIRGRDDWEYIDVYGDSEEKDDANGFNYAWLDQNGRLGIQIKIVPKGTSNGFELERIDFRSRLSVMESRAFPGGPIENYEKLEYDWEAKMERTVAEKNKK